MELSYSVSIIKYFLFIRKGQNSEDFLNIMAAISKGKVLTKFMCKI